MVNANEYEPLELSHLHPAAQPVARLPAVSGHEKLPIGGQGMTR